MPRGLACCPVRGVSRGLRAAGRPRIHLRRLPMDRREPHRPAGATARSFFPAHRLLSPGGRADVRGRLVGAATCLLVALFAKEEAVALPFVLAAWLLILGRRPDSRHAPIGFSLWIVLSLAALAAYLLLRAHSGALTPASAPPYYRF